MNSHYYDKYKRTYMALYLIIYHPLFAPLILAHAQNPNTPSSNQVKHVAINLIIPNNKKSQTQNTYLIPYYSSQLSDDDYTTVDELGYYKIQVPEYYRYKEDDQSKTNNITKVKKGHLYHSGDQQHNAPNVAQSTVLIQSLLGTAYSQAIMGSRQTDMYPDYTNLRRHGYSRQRYIRL